MKWVLAVEGCCTLVDVEGLFCTFRYKLSRGSGILLFGGSFRDLGDIWGFSGVTGMRLQAYPSEGLLNTLHVKSHRDSGFRSSWKFKLRGEMRCALPSLQHHCSCYQLLLVKGLCGVEGFKVQSLQVFVPLMSCFGAHEIAVLFHIDKLWPML